MGYSKSVYKAASDILHERRLNAEKAAESRKEEVYKRFPRVKELEKQISISGIRAARAVLAGGDVKAEVEKLRDRDLAMQAEVKRILRDNNYPENYFEPKYFCKKCNDMGYYDVNGNTIRCSCMKSALISCACAELNKYAPLSLSTFESFDLEYYDKSVNSKIKISPYEHMNKVFNYCQNYAYNFSENSESILMSGETGLGKTHLSLAIANEVIKKGYGVVYASAPPIISELQRQYFSKDKDDSLLRMLINCDLLIIDDLGTELHSPFVVSQVYNLFNSRMLLNKPTIINTNLTAKELRENYTDRFVSRICGNARQLDFLGRDIRIRKK